MRKYFVVINISKISLNSTENKNIQRINHAMKNYNTMKKRKISSGIEQF